MYLGTKFAQHRVNIPNMRAVKTSKHVAFDRLMYSLMRNMNVTFEIG